MRPRPKFCVGEEVALEPKTNPSLRGVRAEILEARWSEFWRNSVTGERKTQVWDYLTSADDTYWHESAIRKLPPEERTQWDDSIFNPTKQGIEA